MSERATDLMTRMSGQVDEIAEFLGTLDDADLRRPCHDEGGDDAGDTVGAAAAHLAEGYHRLGQFLRSTGYAPGSPPADGSHHHGHGRSHGHGQMPEAVADVVHRLHAGKAPVGLLAGLTDEQLDSVPPRVNQFADGHRTLQEVIDEVIAHQAAHLAALRRAVRLGHEPRRRKRRWMAILGLVAVKLVMLAVILVVPSGLALSLGAAHGVVLVVLVISAAVALVVLRLRGKTPRLALSHRPPWISTSRGHR